MSYKLTITSTTEGQPKFEYHIYPAMTFWQWIKLVCRIRRDITEWRKKIYSLPESENK